MTLHLIKARRNPINEEFERRRRRPKLFHESESKFQSILTVGYAFIAQHKGRSSSNKAQYRRTVSTCLQRSSSLWR